MESIEYTFEYTKNDMKRLLSYVYTKYLIFFWIVLITSAIIGFITYLNTSRQIFSIDFFLDWIAPIIVFFALVVYVYAALIKRYMKDPRLIEKKNLKINDTGIEISSDNTLIRILWTEITKIERKDEIVFVRYNEKKVLGIPDYSKIINIENCIEKINLNSNMKCNTD